MKRMRRIQSISKLSSCLVFFHQQESHFYLAFSFFSFFRRFYFSLLKRHEFPLFLFLLLLLLLFLLLSLLFFFLLFPPSFFLSLGFQSHSCEGFHGGGRAFFILPMAIHRELSSLKDSGEKHAIRQSSMTSPGWIDGSKNIIRNQPNQVDPSSYYETKHDHLVNLNYDICVPHPWKHSVLDNRINSPNIQQ